MGYTNDALIENKAAAGKLSPYGGSTYYQYRYGALFTRIDYNWEGKYIVSLTGRRDGSSRFGPGRQFANFGAAGLAWIFSKERWSRNIFPFLSFGKLRASYGTTGNDQIADYGYITTYAAPAAASYQGRSGLWLTRLFNPGYGWELNKKLEVGLELGVAQDQLLLRANYYRNRSSNQLVNYTLSGLSGFDGQKLRELQAGKAWHWSILRPVLIVGLAMGGAMDLIPPLGVYAAMLREQGRPLDFPGGAARVAQAVDVDLLARAIAWSGEAKAAQNEAFNVTNGDVFTWENIWPAVADALEMKPGKPIPLSLAKEFPNWVSSWDALRRQA